MSFTWLPFLTTRGPFTIQCLRSQGDGGGGGGGENNVEGVECEAAGRVGLCTASSCVVDCWILVALAPLLLYPRFVFIIYNI